MCSHSKASHEFLSRVHNHSLKIKKSRMDWKFPKNPINTPLKSKGKGLKKQKGEEKRIWKEKKINLLA